MKKTRGFRLGRRLVKVFKWVIRPRTKPRAYQVLNPPQSSTCKAISKLWSWSRSLKQGALGLCFPKPGYVRVGHDPEFSNQKSVPKGHLAVYVREKDNDTHRYLVPVNYFNHPLFGSLLKQAEKEFGYDHRGGIQIPCRVSEFESVQTKIAATARGRSWRPRSLTC
ncbi:auxin-responsive protein SAUR36-like [Diospyros lotus]|uniref:auxin-responsive protein SAUR36-like n=1 Tax=Diospyros lotus TaxID=55363 RepID=UPI00225BA1DC|nr:auxin-responsive protein SAUR36-like [Diospyros lotus]